MGVRSTSRQAYFNAVEPKLSQKQTQVLVAFQMCKRAANNQEISDFLKWPINAVTPRSLELRELGKLEEAFRGVYPKTNRKVIYWQPVKKEQVANDCAE